MGSEFRQDVAGIAFAITLLALYIGCFSVMDMNMTPVDTVGGEYISGYSNGYSTHNVSEYMEMKNLEENKRIFRDETYSYACGYITGYEDRRYDEIRVKINGETEK